MGKTKETILNYQQGPDGLATTVRYTDHTDDWELFTEREAHKTLFTRLFGPPNKVQGQGAVWYVPYKLLALRKRGTRKLSQEQRAKIAERFASLRTSKPSKLRRPSK